MPSTSSSPHLRVLLLMPASARLNRVAAELAGEKPWQPSVEDSLTTCPQCGQPCWIGPQQRKILNASSLIRSAALCAICCMSATNTVEFSRRNALNIEDHKLPRRLT